MRCRSSWSSTCSTTATSIIRALSWHCIPVYDAAKSGALRWRNYNEVTGKLTVEQTVRRLTNYDAAPGEPKTRLVFNEVKTDSSNRILVMPKVVQDMLKEQKRRFCTTVPLPARGRFHHLQQERRRNRSGQPPAYFSRLLRKLGLEHVKSMRSVTPLRPGRLKTASTSLPCPVSWGMRM